MIKKINYSKKKRYWLLDYINQKNDYDFYVTENNTRIYITDEKSLHKLFRTSSYASYAADDNDECLGLLVVWKSIGGGIKRHYIKLISNNETQADMLLKELLWNFNGELYAKIRKTSRFINLFRKHGFRFVGGRGVQILLTKMNSVTREKKSNG